MILPQHKSSAFKSFVCDVLVDSLEKQIRRQRVSRSYLGADSFDLRLTVRVHPDAQMMLTDDSNGLLSMDGMTVTAHDTFDVS
jgi:hypothetical protein